MPQARRSGAKSTSSTRSGSGSGSGSARSKRATGSSAKAGSASRTAGKRTGGARSTASASSGRARAAAGSPEARLDAAAERVRKLNERIIEAGKQTGESTLASYEKALKAIASAVERGPGSSDIDWISNLATTQAKFIREVAQAWTTAARDMLK